MKNVFLVPDYYDKFACKMGNCLHACCEGWPISFSVEDYFRLSSCECCEELRKKIDTGVKLSLNPTPDHYAIIQPRFDGSCPMRLEDGRCAIHKEVGEDFLSDVCRLYPRGVRIEPGNECSCANSCESVLELLFENDEPILFNREELDIIIPPMGKRAVSYGTMGMETEIRLWLISILENRRFDLKTRIVHLGKSMHKLEDIISRKDEASLKNLLSTQENDSFSFCPNEEHISFGINVMEELISKIDSRSDSVKNFGEKALSRFGEKEEALYKYISFKSEFENAFPKWEIYFEKMLVNHMFFQQFPFQDRPVTLWNEFVSLCSIYALLRFLSMGVLTENKTIFVDLYAAIFRLADHTSFEIYAARVLKNLGCYTKEKIFDIISL